MRKYQLIKQFGISILLFGLLCTSRVSVSYAQSGFPGDANGDGKVDGVDYLTWLINYGKSVSNGPVSGDFNSDGKVDGLDYIIWLNNYGKTATPTLTSTPSITPPSPTNPPIGSCTMTVPNGVGTIDGRKTYSNIKPGDVVCIQSGSSSALTIQNIRGTSSAPITFVNSGGQVVYQQLTVYNSQYFRLTGTGHQNTQYGFKVNAPGSQSANFRLLEKTDNYEVDAIEVSGGNIGVNAKTKASCGSPSWDYNGDGTINSQDEVSASTYITQNIRFHHMYVHNTGAEGYYLGNNNTSSGSCPEIRLENVEVDNNLLADFGVDGINLKGARTGTNRIHHNRILRGSTDVVNRPGQDGSISVTQDSKADITNNWTQENQGPGIRHYGHGPSLIANNVVIRNGEHYSSTNDGGSGIRVTGNSSINNTYTILNNTVVDSKAHGIYLAPGRNGRIQNNIIVGSGGNPIVSDSGLTISNNITSSSSLVGFVNYAGDNFHLSASSLAVNAGINLSTFGVTTDFDGISRPQGSAFDIGAFELR